MITPTINLDRKQLNAQTVCTLNLAGTGLLQDIFNFIGSGLFVYNTLLALEISDIGLACKVSG